VPVDMSVIGRQVEVVVEGSRPGSVDMQGDVLWAGVETVHHMSWGLDWTGKDSSEVVEACIDVQRAGSQLVP
jgi:hypothetical protein